MQTQTVNSIKFQDRAKEKIKIPFIGIAMIIVCLVLAGIIFIEFPGGKFRIPQKFMNDLSEHEFTAYITCLVIMILISIPSTLLHNKVEKYKRFDLVPWNIALLVAAMIMITAMQDLKIQMCALVSIILAMLFIFYSYAKNPYSNAIQWCALAVLLLFHFSTALISRMNAKPTAA
jgi:hypothetical protein